MAHAGTAFRPRHAPVRSGPGRPSCPAFAATNQAMWGPTLDTAPSRHKAAGVVGLPLARMYVEHTRILRKRESDNQYQSNDGKLSVCSSSNSPEQTYLDSASHQALPQGHRVPATLQPHHSRLARGTASLPARWVGVRTGHPSQHARATWSLLYLRHRSEASLSASSHSRWRVESALWRYNNRVRSCVCHLPRRRCRRTQTNVSSGDGEDEGAIPSAPRRTRKRRVAGAVSGRPTPRMRSPAGGERMS